MRSARLRAVVSERWRDPLWWTSVSQTVKTAVAATIAWVLADSVLGLPQAFLAPWSALLVVHATVYRTFSRGLRQVSGAVLGVLLAYVVGSLVGLSTVAVGALLVVGLVVGSARWFRDEPTAVAATGLVVITTGFSQDSMLLDRLLDTAIGIVVGLVVNVVVWAPLRDRAAARAIDAIDDAVGALLREMADGIHADTDEEQVQGWVRQTQELDEAVDAAWGLVRQARESGRLNPRRQAGAVRAAEAFASILSDNEQAIAETRSMALTIGYSVEAVTEWEPLFRDRWLALLREAGEAILAPDSARVIQVRTDLIELAVDLSDEDLSARHWPEYGALVMNLRNVVTAMTRVAAQNPVVLPRRARSDRLLRRGRA